MNIFKKRWIRCALVALSVETVALASPKFSPYPEKDFNYDASALENDTLSTEASADVMNIAAAFAALGYSGLNPKFGSGEAYLDMDQIFTDAELEKTIFWKINLRPDDQHLLNKVLIFEDAYLYHGETSHGVPYALFFDHFNAETVRNLIIAIEEKTNTGATKPEKLSFLRNLTFENIAYADGLTFRPTAHRNTNSKAQVDTTSDEEKAVKNPLPKKNSDFKNVLSNVGNCGKGLALGVKEATYGAVVSVITGAFKVAKTVVKFAQKPPRETWNATRAKYDEIKKLVMNFKFKKFVTHAKNGFNAMPLNTKIEFICTLISENLTGAALAIFAPQAVGASGKTLLKIFDQSQKLEQFRGWFFEGVPSKYVPRTGQN